MFRFVFFALGLCLSIALQAGTGPTRARARKRAVAPCYWGVFEEGLFQDPARMEALGKRLGSKPAMIMWYSDWHTAFPVGACQRLNEKGYVPHIVWEAWKMGDAGSLRLIDILDGKWDAYLQRFGEDAGRFGKPVMIRWGHEFNGNWYPWSGALNGNSPATYVKAYRYVHDRVVAAGGTNLIWMWSPNNGAEPLADWNRIEDYYPGDGYVDWVAMDGYNWGTSTAWGRWSSFAEVFKPCLAAVQKVAPGKPIMIGETATSSAGGDKVAWIQSFFKEVKRYPGLKGWIWFNINKETDWRFDAEPATLRAFKAGLRDPSYRVSPSSLEQLHRRP